MVREHIPLEQGLRLLPPSIAIIVYGQRAYSIRTRIKTRALHKNRLKTHGQRAYSIRTRIKTPSRPLWPFELMLCQRAYSIRTRIKTSFGSGSKPKAIRQRAYSIRTRIKTQKPLTLRHIRSVREHIPLEQGLRLLRSNWL